MTLLIRLQDSIQAAYRRSVILLWVVLEHMCIESQSSSDTTLIKKCASILRDDILAMKCNQLHEPLTVEDVMKGEVDIPDSLQFFFSESVCW